MKKFFLPLVSVIVAVGNAWAAGPEITAKDLPRPPFVPPQDAVKSIAVKKGFHVELVAAEPKVYSPVAIAFDEQGRMFVVEMVDYSERRDETPHLGRIRMLEDTKGTGVYDKSTIYADDLPFPTAVFCYDGGIFVGATPDIIYFKDTKHDGHADVRETVFTGFADTGRLNVQALLNSFNWGLDNRIHGATSTMGGHVKSLRHLELPPVDLNGRDFVIDPRTMILTSEAGGGQHGMSFDEFGHRFTCNNADHIRLYMYDDRYAARNPFYAMPPNLQSIAVDGPAAEVFRISPEEQWRVIRTHWRVGGMVTGPVEGGGRSSGYFTGATGINIYRGDAFPKEFLDNAFVGECAGNLLSRKILYPNDVGLEARRAGDEQKVEFLASTDIWFRPVQFANAPDGTLYLIDMHREVIEHPWSIPENMKKLLNLNSGNNCGRIFRIAPDGFKEPPLPQLGKASTAKLVATLQSHNGWTRDTASRLLFERQDKAAVPMLAKLAAKSDYPIARFTALFSLDGMGKLTPREILKALDDSDPWVRVHAIKLAEKFSKNSSPKDHLFEKLTKMVADDSNQVRYQLAFTLGEFMDDRKYAALAEIAKRDAASPWILAAILSSLAHGSGEVFADLSQDSKFTSSPDGEKFMSQLALLVGAQNNSKEVADVLAFIAKADEPAVSFSLVHALGDGLKRGQSSLEKADTAGQLKTILAHAQNFAADDKTPEATRIEAIKLLELTSYETSSATLRPLLDPAKSEAIQLAAISALAHFSDAQVATDLMTHWSSLSSRVKSETVSALLARPDRAIALLKTIKAGTIPATDLTTAQMTFLRKHSNGDVHQLALDVLGAPGASKLQAVVDAFQPALSLKGDAAEGRKIFSQRCVSCHRMGGMGTAVGPDLVSAKSNGKDKLLISILDPSREVAPQYLAFSIETKDGESYVGILANETAASVTVRQAFGKEDVIMHSNIKGMRAQNQSLMPEGLETGLKAQDLADLLEFITTANADN